MPTLTDDDTKNQIDKNHERGSGAYNPASLDFDEVEAYANDSNNHDNVSSSEKSARHNANPMNYVKNRTKSTATNNKNQRKAGSFLKKKGPIIGIGGGLGIGLIVLAILAPATVMIAIMQNLTAGLDSASRAMNNRQQRVLKLKVEAPDCHENTYACKKTKLSNSSLRKLKRAGLTPLIGNSPMDIDRAGYPANKPTHYRLTTGQTITAAQYGATIDADAALRGKLHGSSGIFNGRISAWTGKHIKGAFRNVFGVKSDGGVMDGKNEKGAFSLANLSDKLAQRIPGYKTLGNISGTIEKKLGSRVATAKAGGVAYITAFGSCLLTKTPSLITGAVAGAQILRLLPYINEIVLSPAAKLQGSGVDEENAATPEDIDFASSILTQKTLDKDGNMTVAVDSPLLLAAMGVNSSKISPATYAQYIPGYSLVDFFNNNPIGSAAKAVQKEAAGMCSVIMSPITMITWMVVEAALRGTNPITLGLGAAAQWVAGMALIPLALAGVATIIDHEAVQELLAAGFLSDDLHGIELGHTLGASALAFFPAGAMARFIPGVTVGGAEATNASIKQYEAGMKEMDIASLSPLDTTSKYTFMGSIVHSLRISAIANSGYSGGISSRIASVLRIPQLSLAPGALADTSGLSAVCDPTNASFYDLEAEDPEQTPLLNPLGLPCSDLEDVLDPDTAIDILRAEGWLDTSIEVSDNADINELLLKEVIVKDKPLYMLASGETGCNDASSGDYIVEASGCVVRPSGKADGTPIAGGGGSSKCGLVGEDGGHCKANDRGEIEDSDFGPTDSTDVKDSRALLAAYTFLVDVQADNAIIGESGMEVTQNDTLSNESEQSLNDTYHAHLENDYSIHTTDWWTPISTSAYVIRDRIAAQPQRPSTKNTSLL